LDGGMMFYFVIEGFDVVYVVACEVVGDG